MSNPPVSTRGALPYRGLSTDEVESRREQYGSNVLTPPKRDPWWRLYLEKFEDPVIRILIIAAVIAIAIGIVDGRYAEGLGIIIAIILATTLAFLNEYKAAREFDVLNKINDEVPVKVIRDGAFTTIPRKDLVVDDVVHIEVGEETPADGKMLDAVSLLVDESRLTGESMPAPKHALEGEVEAAFKSAYSPHQLLRSTMIVDGYGLIRITAVGDHTEIGATARAAAEQTGEETPLNRQLERLSKLIGVVGLGAASFTFIALLVRGVVREELALDSQQWFFFGLVTFGVLVGLVRVWLPILYDALELVAIPARRPAWLDNNSLLAWAATLLVGVLVIGVGVAIGYPLGALPADVTVWLPHEAADELLHFFMIAVTLIVVAVPEGLAMSVTLSLAYSMRKMTASNNLVRRMHACETIGAATVICSDKTGTLTLNEMHVHTAVFPALDGKPPSRDDASEVSRLVIDGMCGNTTAHLSRVEGEKVRALGNPTEGALLLWLDELGIDYMHERSQFEIDSQWTFTTERKFMGTLGRSPDSGRDLLHVKGAPEIVLDRCAQVLTADGPRDLGAADRQELLQHLKEFQRRGMRTLALAYRAAPEQHDGAKLEDLAVRLTWLGFVAIADAVRPEVPAAIDACRRAGVLVKVVTGDNSETCLEIARQIGLWNESDTPDRQMTGSEFAALDDEQAARAVDRIKVLARARPLDKLRLVRLLKQSGHVVAVTGDGTNDAPALNHADVGLSMGRTGTAVAKEASDIVLLDDSFRSIVNAIMWGRSLYENIQRFILFQLTINVAALTIAMLGPFIDVKFPLTVTQMLWVNLIMDTLAALALATEPPHADVMLRPPRNPAAFIVTPAMARNLLGVAGVFVVVLLGLLYFLEWIDHISDHDPTYGGTVFFSVFVLLQFWNLFNARAMGSAQSAFAGLGKSKAFLLIAASILAGQILLVQLGGAVFRAQPLDWKTWLVIIVATSPVLWIGEVWRMIRRMRERGSAQQTVAAS